MNYDYRKTVEETQARADALGSNQGGAWDDFATDTLVAIASGSESPKEMAQAALSAHPRVFHYRIDEETGEHIPTGGFAVSAHKETEGP